MVEQLKKLMTGEITPEELFSKKAMSSMIENNVCKYIIDAYQSNGSKTALCFKLDSNFDDPEGSPHLTLCNVSQSQGIEGIEPLNFEDVLIPKELGVMGRNMANDVVKKLTKGKGLDEILKAAFCEINKTLIEENENSESHRFILSFPGKNNTLNNSICEIDNNNLPRIVRSFNLIDLISTDSKGEEKEEE